MNTIQQWLFLIGVPERARKLRLRVDGLVAPQVDEMFGPEPIQCPTTVLFGANTARLLYADPRYRPALDAWDTGAISKGDLRRFCLMIEKGKYTGPVFAPGSQEFKDEQMVRLLTQSIVVAEYNRRKEESIND